MRVVTTKPTATTKEKLENVDKWLKRDCGTATVRGEPSIKRPEDILERICPKYRSKIYKTHRTINRKRKTSKMWTTVEIERPEIKWKATEFGKELVIPKCFYCLNGKVDCKYRERLFECILHKAHRKTKGSYDFRLMLRRVLGEKWFDENVPTTI